MRTIKTSVLAAAANALAAVPGPAAHADHTEPLVAASVTEVMTVRVGGGVLRRAITGADDRGVYLVIEELQRGEIVSQRRLFGTINGQRVDFERYGRPIKLGGWERDSLSFTVGRGNGRLRCAVDLRYGIEAQCRGRLARGDLPYFGDASQEQINAAIRACGRALDDYALRDRCVRAVADARVEAGALAAACEASFDGDPAELGCIEAGVMRHGDALAVIAACEAGFDGDAAELTCMQSLSQSGLPVAVAGACANAFDGDANEQSCMQALAGTRRNPVELVAHCAGHGAGDADELACIRQMR